MNNWLLDLKGQNQIQETCDEYCKLFLDESNPVEGHLQVLQQLQKTFAHARLCFEPKYSEKASYWGYEYGNFNGTDHLKRVVKNGQYSIVWTSKDNKNWKIVSLTIKV